MTTRHATIGQRRSPARSPLAPPSGQMPTGGAASSVRIPMQGASIIFLALRPPANCREVNVDVHVTQLSTQKSAVVEFSFDATAAGPGCYVVD
jgi:hypothetical protein